MGCGESKHATATANTAITKRSSSSRTNSKKESAPLELVQQQEPKGDIIHIIKEGKGEGEKALEGETKAKVVKESKNCEGVEGAKETIIDKAKVEEKKSIPAKDENGAQAKEGSLEQNNDDVNTNEEYSCF